MDKCYIAGKIGDLPKEVYEAKFEKAKAEVYALHYHPVSPVDLPHNHGKTWSEYMREDIAMLMECSAVYALHDWRLSSGATIEVNLALSVGIDVIHQKLAPKV
jgi:hypothetical protein